MQSSASLDGQAAGYCLADPCAVDVLALRVAVAERRAWSLGYLQGVALALDHARLLAR